MSEHKRIGDNRGFIKHNDEISFFTDLIIDLKLQVLGREMRQPITMERLDQGTKHVGKLMQCRERGLCK
jgi:hypothetical protein